jgi:2,4-didehydro-3-deoxy-L-rhamnonate hydrolase
MRLCRFNSDRLGLVEDHIVYDVTGSLEALPPYRWPFPMGDALVAHLPEIASAAQQLKLRAPKFDLAQVKLRSPIANPSKIMAAPANYRLHVEIDAQDPAIHTTFTTNNSPDWIGPSKPWASSSKQHLHWPDLVPAFARTGITEE